MVVKWTDPIRRLHRIECQPHNPGQGIEFMLRFFCLQNGDDNSTNLRRLLSKLNGLIHIEGIKPCLAIISAI